MLSMLLIIGIALTAGYTLAVLCSLLLTMAIASAAPRFVLHQHCLRPQYKLTHTLLWTLVCVGSGFASAQVVGSPMLGWLTSVLLAGVLTFVLWSNSWEARQRGLPYQILLSVMTAVGVLVGAFLRLR